MALKDLSTPTMVTISGSLVDPKADRPLIESLPQAGALLPSLDKAHGGLLHTQVREDEVATSLATLQAAEARVDLRYDRKSRGSYNVLTGFADLADDPEVAAQYLALRDTIYPTGLEIIKWSYTDEAGEVELTDKRLSKDDKALLGKLPTPSGTLLDAFKERIKAGRELGGLEKERAILEKKAPDAPTGADTVRARNLWIRTLNAFVATLALEEDLSDEDREKILGPLRRADQKAARRGAGAAEAKPTDVKPADVKPAAGEPVDVEPADVTAADAKKKG